MIKIDPDKFRIDYVTKSISYSDNTKWATTRELYNYCSDVWEKEEKIKRLKKDRIKKIMKLNAKSK